MGQRKNKKGKKREREEQTATDGSRRRTAVAIAVGSCIAGVVTAFAVDWHAGSVVGGIGLLVAIGWDVFKNPPPPKAGPKNPAGLNFGN